MTQRAIGLIETDSLVSAIAGADAAAKNAQITLIAAELNDGGLVTVRLEGELADVQVAVEAAAAAVKQLRQTVTTHVIARPSEELTSLLQQAGFVDLARGETLTVTRKPASQAKPQPRSKPPTTQPKPVPESVVLEKPPAVEVVKAAPVPTPEPVKTVGETESKTVTTPAGSLDWAEIEHMPVVKLRRFARTVKGLPLQGRQISMANKTRLLEVLRKHLNR